MKIPFLLERSRIANQRRGFTLVEMLIVMGIGSLVLMAVMQTSIFTARSFAAMGNYADLDQHSRNALDRMSTEIRTGKIQEVSPNRLGFTNQSGRYFAYAYNANAQTLTRLAGPSPDTLTEREVLLTGCDFFRFRVFLRNPTNQFWFPWEATGQEANTKLIDLTWRCSRRVIDQFNTESVQTAKIVLRN